ncbi:peptide MFS transporter [Nocardioides iriomotensis]|uniref:Peptide MFS transporter n=1 Tax=Nocardioides iriomotensis TaxID=715784 RepID=A0A4Q5J648_9ACTN|nr:peptide MFS transporter [Nocardioides iriomotensis]RYU14107.1 peptide MFS transporter [Nocardioides iriomotensis]
MTETSTTRLDPAGQSEKTFFGQPRVLANLFGVEMWERFSFYGMQGILLIYLYYSAAEGGLGVDKAVASGIVGAYGGGVYLSTILGAWLADRVMGAERTLFSSAIVVMAGHIALSLIPGLPGVGVGLILVALGSGGLKATATSLVGSLYAEDDDRRDAGFSIFYMGINLGALVGPLLTGLLQKEWGFHVGFGLAAVGMALGLLQYSLGRKRLPEETHHVPNPLHTRGRIGYGVAAVGVVGLIVTLVAIDVITAARLADIVVWTSAAAAVVYFVVILSSKDITGVERRRVLAFIPMFIASAVFWSLYQQQFTVVTIYSDERLNRDLFGWEMPVSWVQSINPIFIIVLAGVFAAMWTKLGDRQPSTPVKFALGTMSIGVSFLLFIPMAGGGQNSAPLLGLVGVLLFFTISELLLSPVGLSLSTKLAPRKFHTQMVALFFLSIALGTAMSGLLSGYYDPNSEVPYFGVLGAVAIAVGVVLLLVTKPIRRLMGGVH